MVTASTFPGLKVDMPAVTASTEVLHALLLAHCRSPQTLLPSDAGLPSSIYEFIVFLNVYWHKVHKWLLRRKLRALAIFRLRLEAIASMVVLFDNYVDTLFTRHLQVLGRHPVGSGLRPLVCQGISCLAPMHRLNGIYLVLERFEVEL